MAPEHGSYARATYRTYAALHHHGFVIDSRAIGLAFPCRRAKLCLPVGSGAARPASRGALTTMSNLDEQTTVTRKAVAKHFLLDAAGEVTEDETKAKGFRYEQISTGEKFDYMVSDAAIMMLACFGGKTLATNEASQVRNGKLAGGDAEQMEAIKNRFALLDQGEWVDRTRESAAPNLDWLAESSIVVLLADGKITQEQVGDAKAKIRQKLEDDPAYVKTARQHPRVAAEYARLAGRVVKTTDDLMAAIS
jgi:hypothetical protein